MEIFNIKNNIKYFETVVSLNHLYLVVGSEIYQKLADFFSSNMNFATVESKVMKTKDRGEWQGLYVRGKHTYIEFFDSFNNKPVGSLGLGFGLDEPQQLPQLCKISKVTYPNVEIKNLCLEEDENPLFSYLEYPSEDNKLSYFVLQYTEDTFKTKSFEKRSKYKAFSDKSVSREKYNADAFDPDKTFKDIEKIEIELSTESTKSFEALASVLKFEKSRDECGHLCLAGDGIKFVLKNKVDSSIGINIHASLNKPVAEKMEIEFGSTATLGLEEERAVFRFK